MGGMDWAGLEIVAEILGIDDMELLIVQLNTLRRNEGKFRHGS